MYVGRYILNILVGLLLERLPPLKERAYYSREAAQYLNGLYFTT
jgi:hypothetical protein